MQRFGSRRKAIVLAGLLQLAVTQDVAAQRMAAQQYVPGAPAGIVSDFAGVVALDEEARMTALLERLRAATAAEIAVVTLPTIGESEAADVALLIGRQWGVGLRGEVGDSLRNRGLVLLLVPRQDGRPGTGHLRIEVGDGLEGVVPDGLAGRVRDQVMGPMLAREEYGPALVAGTEALVTLIATGFGVTDSALAQARPLPVRRAREGPGGWVGMLPMILFFLVFFIILPALSRKGRGRRSRIYWGGPWGGGGWGGGGGWSSGGGGWGGGGGFGGFGGGGGFSGGGAGGRF